MGSSLLENENEGVISIDRDGSSGIELGSLDSYKSERRQGMNVTHTSE